MMDNPIALLPVETDINREYARLYLERQTLIDRRLNLLQELRVINIIRSTYTHVVHERYMAKDGIPLHIQRWTDATHNFHDLYKEAQSELAEVRLELEENRASLRRMRKDARNF